MIKETKESELLFFETCKDSVTKGSLNWTSGMAFGIILCFQVSSNIPHGATKFILCTIRINKLNRSQKCLERSKMRMELIKIPSKLNPLLRYSIIK
jgi:hypothetical protein